MPAAPIMGLIFCLANRLYTLATSTPPMVSNTKATSPSARIIRVCRFKKYSACILDATVSPSSRVMRFASTFCAVSDRLSSTPHSRMRLPNIKKPTSATLRGTNSPATMVIMMGNRIFAVLLTCFSAYGMRIRRSFLVVTSRMTGGWMMGTSAM